MELNAGKLTVRVCGLADIAVKEGDTVAVGDALGTVGELPPRAPWKRMCIWSSWRTALMWTRRNISPRWNKAAHERRRADGKTRCPRAAFCCARLWKPACAGYLEREAVL
ncbi:MAG: hypothetical protein ACLRRT_00455 [Ruthenibacterium lactatiformans]